METAELLEIIARGENSRHRFNVDATNATSLASEIAALANGSGGRIFIGVANDGTVHALGAASVARINQPISKAASDCIRPPVDPVTENVGVRME